METVAVWMGRQSCFFSTDLLSQEKINFITPDFFHVELCQVLVQMFIYISVYSAQIIYCIYTENYPSNVVRVAVLASSQNLTFAFKKQNVMMELHSR